MNGFAFLSAEQIEKARIANGQLEYTIRDNRSNSEGELHLDCKMSLADFHGKECVLFISREGNYYVVMPERPEELLCAASPKSMGYAKGQKSVLEFQKNGWICGCPSFVPSPKAEMIDLPALENIGDISEREADFFFGQSENPKSDSKRHLKQIFIVEGVRMTYSEMIKRKSQKF